MKRVVFVCSGNICRSPMAAAMATKLLRESEIPAAVISAGTLNIQGSQAAAEAVEAMAEIGVELDGHRSQGVSAHLMRLADHLVVMSPEHEQYMIELEPELANKIHRLWEYAEPSGRIPEIADPVGQPVEAFRACRDELAHCLKNWLARFALR